MNLYLSALRLDRQACHRLKIKDCYSLHRVVYDLFDDIRTAQEKRQDISSGIQWVDKGGDYHYRQLLILSDRLPRQTDVGELETKPLPPQFISYPHYRFCVCMNPTRRNNQTRRLEAVRGREAIADWFCRRTEQWGFQVEPRQLQVDGVQVLQFDAGENKSITLQQATLQGRLTVTQPDVFAQSFRQGIGRARTFGCGLLQIVPLIEPNFFD